MFREPTITSENQSKRLKSSSGTPSRYIFLAGTPFNFNSQTGALSTPALYIASCLDRGSTFTPKAVNPRHSCYHYSQIDRISSTGLTTSRSTLILELASFVRLLYNEQL